MMVAHWLWAYFTISARRAPESPAHPMILTRIAGRRRCSLRIVEAGFLGEARATGALNHLR